MGLVMSDKFSVTITGLNALRAQGLSASGLYTAKLVDWSDEETAVGNFFWLADAIGYLAQALEDGAVVKRASIYSARDELIWTMPGARSGQRRETAMMQNALRKLIQIADDCPIAPA